MVAAAGAAAVAVLLLAGVVLLGVAGGGASNVVLSAFQPACPVSGPVPGLSADQAANADTIVAAAFAVSGESARAARIALMTAITESGLHNDPPGVGGGGSVGLFQQIAGDGWGTVAQELNPADATQMFVRRLLAVPGWQTIPPWAAAQTVQRSGAGQASDGLVNYGPSWQPAGVYLAAVIGNGSTPGGCDQGIPSGVVGAGRGLPAGYTIPPGTGPAHARVVRFVVAQLGKPYVWGAAGPDAFDCSGLTMAAWASAGVRLAHFTGTQQAEGVAVSVGGLRAGDLVLTPGSDSPGPGIAGHVGVYLGYGLVLSAIDRQMGVAVQSWRAFVGGGLDGLRDPAPGD